MLADKSEGNAGTTPFTFTVTRTGGLNSKASVGYTITGIGQNPVTAADFANGVLPSGTVSFAAGQATATILVQVQADASVEADESFKVMLTPTSSLLLGATATASGTIRNDDAPPTTGGTTPTPVFPNTATITPLLADKLEGSAGTTPFTFIVTRTGDLSGAASLGYTVSGAGQNPAAADGFVNGMLPSGTVSFAPGWATATVSVQVQADASVEPDESFKITLTPTSSLTLGATAAALGTIRNDDIPPTTGGIGGGTGTGNTGGGTGETTPVPVSPGLVTITAAEADKPEGSASATPFTFTVTRTGDLSGAGTLAYTVTGAGEHPAAADDFVGGAFPSGNVQFNPGEASKTINVAVQGDTEQETDGAFQVNLSALGGNLALGTAAASGLIRGDDAHQIVVTAPGRTVLQDGPGSRLYVGTADHEVLTSSASARNTQIGVAPNGDVVLTRGDQTSVLRGVAEVSFVDGRLVFDADDPAARVARLYQAGLGRQPDTAGLSYWTDSVRNGAGLGQLAGGFLGSPEFASRFGQGGTDTAFVDAIYQNVLGRAPDAGGQVYWTGLLQGGTGRADVLAGISESGENKQATASLVQGGIWDLDPGAAQAARMYDTVLGRLPDAAGLGFWAQQIDADALTLQDMADRFVDSAEFRQVYGSLSNRDFVQAIYGNTLHRPGDASGVDYWTARLDQDATSAQIVVGFSEPV